MIILSWLSLNKLYNEDHNSQNNQRWSNKLALFIFYLWKISFIWANSLCWILFFSEGSTFFNILSFLRLWFIMDFLFIKCEFILNFFLWRDKFLISATTFIFKIFKFEIWICFRIIIFLEFKKLNIMIKWRSSLKWLLFLNLSILTII